MIAYTDAAAERMAAEGLRWFLAFAGFGLAAFLVLAGVAVVVLWGRR